MTPGLRVHRGPPRPAGPGLDRQLQVQVRRGLGDLRVAAEEPVQNGVGPVSGRQGELRAREVRGGRHALQGGQAARQVQAGGPSGLLHGALAHEEGDGADVPGARAHGRGQALAPVLVRAGQLLLAPEGARHRSAMSSTGPSSSTRGSRTPTPFAATSTLQTRTLRAPCAATGMQLGSIRSTTTLGTASGRSTSSRRSSR